TSGARHAGKMKRDKISHRFGPMTAAKTWRVIIPFIVLLKEVHLVMNMKSGSRLPPATGTAPGSRDDGWGVRVVVSPFISGR
ncbi:MAG: hypothetical protein ACE5E7_16565, partial [Anaerolineae bacterium]